MRKFFHEEWKAKNISIIQEYVYVNVNEFVHNSWGGKCNMSKWSLESCTHKSSFLLSGPQARRQHVRWANRFDFLDAAEFWLQQKLIEITNYLLDQVGNIYEIIIQIKC